MSDGNTTNALVHVLDSTIEFVDGAISNEARLQGEVNELRTKLAETERVYLEKVASAQKSATLDPDAINAAVDRLVTLKIIPFELHTKVANQLRKEPRSALTLLTQVAETLVSAPAEGFGVTKEAGTVEGSGDPDGWDEVLQGRVPQIRQPK